MDGVATSEEPSRLNRIVSKATGSTLAYLVAIVAVMWVIEIADTVILSDRLQRNGIHPRSLDGLDGIIWTPWLHSNFGHIMSNSVPLIALGWLVALRGTRYWLLVTLFSMVVGGGLTWLLASGGNHIGASGIVFGYFGALGGAAWVDRRPRSFAPALVAVMFYSTMLVGIVPQDRISWEGHLFGLIAGFIAAWRLAEPEMKPESVEDDDEPLYSWELDKPWESDN